MRNRICRDNGVWSVFGKKKPNASMPGGPPQVYIASGTISACVVVSEPLRPPATYAKRLKGTEGENAKLKNHRK